MSVAAEIEQKARQMASTVLTVKSLKRIAALVIDFFVCLAISLLPLFGWIVAIAFFCLRDALPFSGRRSFGKSVYKLRIVDSTDHATRLSWRKFVLRNIILFIPILNLVDIYTYATTGSRLADVWTSTEVIDSEM